MKQSKWKEILTSNQMFIVYIIVVLCIAISMKTPAFAEVSTIITLARALLVTLCFAICEMVVIISARYQELAAQEDKVIFGGRLGAYRYYDMDKVIEAALELVFNIF